MLTVFHNVHVVPRLCKLLSYLRKISLGDLKPRRLVQLLPGARPLRPGCHLFAIPSITQRPALHSADLTATGLRPRPSLGGPPIGEPPPIGRERLAMRWADLHGRGSRGAEVLQGGALRGPRQVGGLRLGEGAPLCTLVLYLVGLRRGGRGPDSQGNQAPRTPNSTVYTAPEGEGQTWTAASVLDRDSCVGRSRGPPPQPRGSQMTVMT